MKNKGFWIIGVFLWEYIFVMICASLDLTTSGGELLTIPTDATFIEIVGTYFQIIGGLLSFSVSGIPDIIIFIAVYLPLLILLTALAFFVRGD